MAIKADITSKMSGAEKFWHLFIMISVIKPVLKSVHLNQIYVTCCVTLLQFSKQVNIFGFHRHTVLQETIIKASY